MKCRRVPITSTLATQTTGAGGLSLQHLDVLTLTDACSTHSTAWDHIECDDSQASGCLRHCAPRPSTLCCDLCNPQSFEHLAAPLLQPAARAMNKSHIKKHTLTNPERDSRSAILEWRKIQARALYQQALLMDLGNDIFMSTMVIDRIIDCAHVRKLLSIDSLKREQQSHVC